VISGLLCFVAEVDAGFILTVAGQREMSLCHARKSQRSNSRMKSAAAACERSTV
jgi:hypothetical protein